MTNRLLPMSVSAMALMALSACGAGGPGSPDVPDIDVTASPIPGVSAATLSSNAGLSLNDAKTATSAATIGYQGRDEHGGWAGHSSQAAVTVVSDPDQNIPGTNGSDTTGIVLWMEGDNVSGMTEWDLYRFMASSPELAQTDLVRETTLGDDGRMVVLDVRGGALNGGHTVYLPANGSGASVGAWAGTDAEESGMYAVFGRESTIEDISRQTGSARFSGIATATAYMNYHASEVQEEEILLFARQGEYSGTSDGSLNFDTGAFTMEAQLTNSTGNQMLVGTSGYIGEDGVMRSAVIVDGLRQNGGTVSGDFEGHVFGENGGDLGGTFAAGIGDLREGYYPDDAVGVAGALIMSETGPRSN